MKYRRSIDTNFNYMGNNVVSFAPDWNQIATVGSAAGAGALAAGVGANIYNQNQINSNRTPQETKKYMRYADQYNKGFDGWQNSTNPDKGWIADESTPEGKRFITTGQRFIDEDQRLRDKYSNKAVTYGSLVGGGLLSGGLAYALTRGRG